MQQRPRGKKEYKNAKLENAKACEAREACEVKIRTE
jgi:hypothetical protein